MIDFHHVRNLQWIKLLVVESQKDGLQIPVKMIASDARAFQSTLKMQITAMRHRISIYGFSMRHMSRPIDRHGAENFDVFLPYLL